MKSSAQMPHCIWYFLLCYLAYSSYTYNFVALELLRPKLMVIYHLNHLQITPHFLKFFHGLMVGGILFGILVNIINYRTCFIWLWLIQILGLIKLLALSPIIVGTPVIHQLKSGMLLLGIANGGIFATIHPLIALTYQNSRQSQTQIMNFLHTNWPLFVIIAYLIESSLRIFHGDWFTHIYVMLFLSSSYFVVANFLPMPVHRYAHRIPVSTRFKSMLRPGYVLLLFSMICSCVIEYSPATWIKHWVEIDLKLFPLFFILFINILQITFRLLAGTIANKISPPGLLGLGSIITVLSLFWLHVGTNMTGILFAIGLLALSTSWCWPTYLAIVADRYPLSGGLGMSIMNVTGFLALQQIVPDFARLIEVETQSQAFLDVARFGIFGGILLIGVYVAFRTQGGYKILSTYERSL